MKEFGFKYVVSTLRESLSAAQRVWALIHVEPKQPKGLTVTLVTNWLIKPFYYVCY